MDDSTSLQVASRKWILHLTFPPRFKKYQYVFYKHFLFHGLNLSIALTDSDFHLVGRPNFQVCVQSSSFLLRRFTVSATVVLDRPQYCVCHGVLSTNASQKEKIITCSYARNATTSHIGLQLRCSSCFTSRKDPSGHIVVSLEFL